METTIVKRLPIAQERTLCRLWLNNPFQTYCRCVCCYDWLPRHHVARIGTHYHADGLVSVFGVCGRCWANGEQWVRRAGWAYVTGGVE